MASKGLHQLCCLWYKAVVKVHHAQKLCLWERDDSVFGNSLSEKVDEGQPELALGQDDNQALLAEPLEESPGVRHMLCPGGAGSEDVNQIYE